MINIIIVRPLSRIHKLPSCFVSCALLHFPLEDVINFAKLCVLTILTPFKLRVHSFYKWT